MDGTAKGNPARAGVGGLIWGYVGALHEVFAANCISYSCAKVELLGVMRGLAIAWNGRHRKVQLTIYSETVVWFWWRKYLPIVHTYYLEV